MYVGVHRQILHPFDSLCVALGLRAQSVQAFLSLVEDARIPVGVPRSKPEVVLGRMLYTGTAVLPPQNTFGEQWSSSTEACVRGEMEENLRETRMTIRPVRIIDVESQAGPVQM